MQEFFTLLKEGGYGVAAILLGGVVWLYLSKEALRDKHAENVEKMRAAFDKEMNDLRAQMQTLVKEHAAEIKEHTSKRFTDFEKLMVMITGFEQGRTALVQSNRDLATVIDQLKERLFRITAGGT